MRTIRLTEPFLHGADVTRLQQLLSAGRFGNFKPGPIDGQAGPKTLDAVRRAKWALGYRTPNRRAGALLIAYLAGERKIHAGMAKRRTARLNNRPAKSLRQKAYEYAITQIGERESSYNICTSTLWWFHRLRIPIGWCSIFASRCYRHVGSKTFHACIVVLGRVLAEGYSDYSEQMLSDAIAHRRGLDVVTEPERGDLVVWQWDVGATDHTSLLESRGDGATVRSPSIAATATATTTARTNPLLGILSRHIARGSCG